MSRRSVRWARALMGAAVLAVVAWHSGAGGFIAGVQAVDTRTLLAASALTFVATVCCASRWKLVASCLGVDVSLRTAIASYYRSQFLNVVLPGGVLGDVPRGLHHGHRVRNVSADIRSVGWERVAGQAVQLGVVGLVLLALPSPVPWALPVAAAALAVGMGTGWVVLWRLGRRCLEQGSAALSIVVSGCHVATFVVAARAVTPNIPVARLLPLACLVLLAAAVPANLGGWGPRQRGRGVAVCRRGDRREPRRRHGHRLRDRRGRRHAAGGRPPGVGRRQRRPSGPAAAGARGGAGSCVAGPTHSSAAACR